MGLIELEVIAQRDFFFLFFFLLFFHRALSDFLPPLLQLAASPIYGVRAMSAQALVAMIPPTEYVSSVLSVVKELPEKPSSPGCHNRIHGQLLQIKAILTRVLHTDKWEDCRWSFGKAKRKYKRAWFLPVQFIFCPLTSYITVPIHLPVSVSCAKSKYVYCVPISSPHASFLCDVVQAMEARIWLASHEQRCPLVRQAYVVVLRLLRENCSRDFLFKLGSLLMKELHRTPHTLEVQIHLHFASS